MVYIALPVLNEWEQLPGLLKNLSLQEFENFKLVVCVNQYDHWWKDELKKDVCLNNEKSLKFLDKFEDIDIHVIDRSSPKKGWKKKKGGVGWARKVIMDWISDNSNDDTDIIVSMDADTIYPSDYLLKVKNYFCKNKQIYGIAVPYYHPLGKDDIKNKLILRYEIYMRCYFLNLLRIKNTYAFSALGSAMAFPVWAYKKVGGLTPVQSGEDFYFLQKLVKYGRVGIDVDTVVYPSSRFSDRVNFGTGPALIKGYAGNWDSYPVYPIEYFDEIKTTFLSFSDLYEKDKNTPMDKFIMKKIKGGLPWQSFRKNYKDDKNFVKACHNYIDGLRILQYLRYRSQQEEPANEQSLIECLEIENIQLNKEMLFDVLNRGLDNLSLNSLSYIRDKLFEIESIRRKGFI